MCLLSFNNRLHLESEEHLEEKKKAVLSRFRSWKEVFKVNLRKAHPCATIAVKARTTRDPGLLILAARYANPSTLRK